MRGALYPASLGCIDYSPFHSRTALGDNESVDDKGLIKGGLKRLSRLLLLGGNRLREADG